MVTTDSSSGSATQTASGGTETTSGDYTVNTFTTSGTFTVATNAIADIEYLVVYRGAFYYHYTIKSPDFISKYLNRVFVKATIFSIYMTY